MMTDSWTIVRVGPIQVKRGVPIDKVWEQAEKPVSEAVDRLIQSCGKDQLWSDPSFGPTEKDADGSFAFYGSGKRPDSRYPDPSECEWVRPVYSTTIKTLEEELKEPDSDSSSDEDEEKAPTSSQDDYSDPSKVFCTNADCFDDGINANDVIQGRLGDCWILSSMAVLASRGDLMEKCFWRCNDVAMEANMRKYGFRVCRVFKDSQWYFIIVDDRLPVFSKSGKPVFAHSRHTNELWVSLLEKAYAKLHKAYDSLIGGYIDGGLRDLTGLCAEELVLRKGHVGFHPQNLIDMESGALWNRLDEYANEWGCMMGCSIQPDPTTSGNVKSQVESKVGSTGLMMKHAYSLIDVGIVNGVKLVRLRNPWGFGEWTGSWSDKSKEFKTYKEELDKVFSGPICKRNDIISTSQKVTSNENDGAFFIPYDEWKKYFTVLFAAVDFPDSWSGQRVSGSFGKSSAGGNSSLKTWVMNPKHRFSIPQDNTRVYVSLCQRDPRLTEGSQQAKAQAPIGFHIVEDNGKDFPARPPAMVPGASVSQAVYKLHLSVDLDIKSMKKGNYIVVPSVYYADKQIDYFLHLYTDKPIAVENGQLIAEENDADDEPLLQYSGSKIPKVPKETRKVLKQFDKYRIDLEDELRACGSSFAQLAKALPSNKNILWKDWSEALSKLVVQPDEDAFNAFAGDDKSMDASELAVLVDFEKQQNTIMSGGDESFSAEGDESFAPSSSSLNLAQQASPLVTNAVKELQQENNGLRGEIDELKKEQAKMMHLLLLYGKMLKCYDGPLHSADSLLKPVEREARKYELSLEETPSVRKVKKKNNGVRHENLFESILKNSSAGDEFMAVKPWKGTIDALTPKTPPTIPSLEKSLEIDYVFGYNCSRNAIRTNSSAQPVYFSAALGIILDTKNNTQTYFTGHTDDIKCIDIHDDLVVTGQEGKNPFACIWDGKTGKHILTLNKFQHQRGVIHVAFSKDGSEVLTVGGDDNHTLAIYDAKTGDKKSDQKGDKGNVYFATHTGTRFVTGGSKHTSFWEPKKKKATFGKIGGGGTLEYLSAASDGNVLVIGGSSGSVFVFEDNTCKSATDVATHSSKAVQALCFDSSSSCFVSGGSDGTVVTWKLNGGKLESAGKYSCTNPVKAIQNGFVGLGNGTIVTNNEQQQVLMNAHFAGELWALAVDPTSESTVATACDDCTLKIWDVAGRKQLRQCLLPGPCRAIGWSTDGKTIAVGQPENSVIFMNAETLEPICTKPRLGMKETQKPKNPPTFSCIVFSPDGKFVACGSHNAQVIVLDVESFKPKMILKSSSATVTQIDFSKDSQFIRTNDMSYELLFYSIATKKQATSATQFLTTEWATHTCPLSYETQGIWPSDADGTDINSVNICGSLMATADDNGKVNLYPYPYPARTKDTFKEYSGHSAHVTNVSFVNDKYVMSAGGRDKALICWKII